MSCSNCNCNPCVCPTQVEPLSSQVNNLTSAVLGVVSSALDPNTGAWVWTQPCNLSDPSPIPGFPRLPNEGNECYILRLFIYLNSIIGGGISFPILVNQGGTGATTAAQARTNLGINFPVDVANGGTGANNAPGALANLGGQPACANLDTWCLKAAPSGAVVGDTDSQTLTNKEVTNPDNTAQVLTEAATVAWNMDLGGIATLALTANRNMGAPTNIKKGTYALAISGAFSITSWDAVFKWGSTGTPPTMAGSLNVFTFVSYDGATLVGAAVTDVA